MKTAELQALKEEPFILLKQGHGIRDKIDFLFQINDMRPKIVMETTNNETAFGLAAAGMGFAIVPEYNIRRLVTNNPIDIFKLSEQGMKWTVAAIFVSDSTVPLRTRECIRIIQNCHKNKEKIL